MSSVWFIVPGVGKKIITSKQWQFYGITAEDSIWGPENGWSVPESSFSAMQLNILDGDSGFLLGQEDGPRTYPPPPGDMLNDEVSGFAYYIATKKLLEQLEIEGGATVYVQQANPETTNPGYTGPAIWYQTNAQGKLIGKKVRA